MSSARYFVTGASGFVGRRLCARLRSSGQRVCGLTRRPDAALARLGVEVVIGDLQRPETWGGILAENDYVIHCAAAASFSGGDDYAGTNVEGTRLLLQALAAGDPGLRRLVFVSTIGAVDRAAADPCRGPLDEASPLCPTSAYGRSKVAAEELVRRSGLPYAIVRPAMVIGPDMRVESHFAAFARLALRHSPLAWFAWPGAFSVVHVEDLAAALELCATHPGAEGKIFFCAGEPLGLQGCFAQASPGRRRIPLGWAVPLARTLAWALPFRLKALLLPALTATDHPLRQLGWQPAHPARQAFDEVLGRERARLDSSEDPGGQTVVSGAASGLGRALAERLAPRRRELLLIDRDPAGLAEVQRAYPHVRTAVVDLADETALAAWIQDKPWQSHPVRELYACAGIGIRGPVLMNTPEDHARLFKVNLLARLTLAHAALPAMAQHQMGRIILISSSAAFQPLPYMASYAASNAALLLLGEAWGAEVGASGVAMVQVCPGGMETNFQRTAGVKKLASERLMLPGEVADRILASLGGRSGTILISTRARGMALLARLLPRAVSVALWRRLMEKLR